MVVSILVAGAGALFPDGEDFMTGPAVPPGPVGAVCESRFLVARDAVLAGALLAALAVISVRWDLPLALTSVSVANPWLAVDHLVIVLAGAGLLMAVDRGRRARNLKRPVGRGDDQIFRDALTGLPGRVLFFDRLELATASSRGLGTATAVLLLGLDRFKDINDAVGHQAGDQLLRQVAGRLAGAARKVDTVSRLGGDQFAVVVVDLLDAEAVDRIVERFLAVFAEPFAVSGTESGSEGTPSPSGLGGCSSNTTQRQHGSACFLPTRGDPERRPPLGCGVRLSSATEARRRDGVASHVHAPWRLLAPIWPRRCQAGERMFPRTRG